MTIHAKPSPLVILGFDTGDPGFIQGWAKEGYLPTVASIMERGWWAQTAGAELISEHGVWTSLLSGISRNEHGYYYFRQLKPGTYDLEAVCGSDINAPPFWSHIKSKDKKVAIIDVPDTLPIPELPGVQIANWDVHNTWNPDYYKTTSEPAEIAQEVHRKFGPNLVPLERHESSFEDDRGIYRQLLGRVEKKGALCRHFLKRDQFDIIVIIFSESHAANHQFWKYHPEIREQGAKENELTHAIRNVFHATDREMGRILEELPQQANIFILSSVGMEDDYPISGLTEAFTRRLGYQVSPESGGISLKPIDLARRVIPESWRVALSRRLSREKRERLLAEQFRNGTDWRKTTAFSIPSPYTSFIRVNLRGREPQGIVETGAAYVALLDRIESDLKQLVDPETNKPAVTKVTRTVEMFDCPPHVSLPDLFVEWQPGRFMQRVLHPKTEIVQGKPDFFRRSDHSPYGFVAAAGSSIQKRGALGNVEVLNLAPTFLSLTGEPVSERMTGQTMTNMIKS